MAKYSLIKEETTPTGDTVLWIEEHGLWTRVHVVRTFEGAWYNFEDGKRISAGLYIVAEGFLKKLLWEQADREVVDDEPCSIPPDGWSCSRGDGHDGPCAATSDAVKKFEARLKDSCGSDNRGGQF